MFLGYYMFLLSQTIKEGILPEPIIPTKKYRYRLYLIPGNTNTEKMTGITVVSNSKKRVSASLRAHKTKSPKKLQTHRQTANREANLGHSIHIHLCIM